jgi:hypothetical protein
LERSLKSLSSGLTAPEDDNINFDTAEEVGRNIQKKLDQLRFEDAKISRINRVHTLDELQVGIKVDKWNVHIDPAILFTRRTAIIGTKLEMSEHFKYELTPEPKSLFKGSMMRKPSKSALRNKLLDLTEASKTTEENVCVVNGGALLHKVIYG